MVISASLSDLDIKPPPPRVSENTRWISLMPIEPCSSDLQGERNSEVIRSCYCYSPVSSSGDVSDTAHTNIPDIIAAGWENVKLIFHVVTFDVWCHLGGNRDSSVSSLCLKISNSIQISSQIFCFCREK